MLKLPGLIDPHVHLREPDAPHKEDWDTGMSAIFYVNERAHLTFYCSCVNLLISPPWWIA